MNLPEILQNVPFIWFIVGLLFAFAELLAPGFVLIFFALGAWLMALLSLFIDIEIAMQIILFVLASLLGFMTLRQKLKSQFFKENKNTISEDDEFTGQEVKVIEDIAPGKKGKVEFKGANWGAKAEVEIKAGTLVKIVGKESINLIVTP